MKPTRAERWAWWWALPGWVCLGLWVFVTFVGDVSISWHALSQSGPYIVTHRVAVGNGCLTAHRDEQHVRDPTYVLKRSWDLTFDWITEAPLRASDLNVFIALTHRPDGGVHRWIWSVLHSSGIGYGRSSSLGHVHYLILSVPLLPLFLMFALPWLWLRLLRWKRTGMADNLCPVCRYDVRGLERGCSECGWSRRASQHTGR